MNHEIGATQLKQRILAREEIAIIDVREQGIYFDCHLFWATNIPLSRLECLVRDLLPRRSVPIVVYDSGPPGKETAARRARDRLVDLDYTDVSVLKGGIDGWKAAGLELFSGLNVPSKTFGEYLLEQRKPPELLAETLHARLQANDDIVVLDSRPMDEYNEMSIPGAIDVPGAELVYRIFEVAPNPETDVVVNCAGRTRSIVGAMSLINARIPNNVSLLKDGTMGWHLAGLRLDHGKSREGAPPSEENLSKSVDAAYQVAERFDVSFVDYPTLCGWKRDPERSLYVFDVRTQQEFETAHVIGSIHAPGGQLVQTTDEFIAVRNARTVLVDNKEVRAIMTASWLMQMGHHDVHVLKGSLDDMELESGARKEHVAGYRQFETIRPGELRAALQSGEKMMVVDLSSSRNYRQGHIPQAHWCIRQRLESALVFHQPVGLLVLTSEDGLLAHLAAADLIRSDPRQLIRVLNGGNHSWKAAGFPLCDGMDNLLTDVTDVWDKPYHHETNQEDRMRSYLEWEVQLMEQADRDGTVEFFC
ncbi:MAG: rhodanese-like domain-containing protein [Acidiferrobacterales bacterium]|nr:rhodanese-like domain-containing protein [Acidiferrobacterales bacterium]